MNKLQNLLLNWRDTPKKNKQLDNFFKKETYYTRIQEYKSEKRLLLFTGVVIGYLIGILEAFLKYN